MSTSRRSRTAEERYERLRRTQTLLTRVASELGPAVDLHAVLDTVLRAMHTMVDFGGGSI